MNYLPALAMSNKVTYCNCGERQGTNLETIHFVVGVWIVDPLKMLRKGLDNEGGAERFTLGLDNHQFQHYTAEIPLTYSLIRKFVDKS